MADKKYNLELIAGELEQSPDYRVLRKVTKRNHFCEPSDLGKHIGIVLDVETTGLDFGKEKLIELGMIAGMVKLGCGPKKLWKAIWRLRRLSYQITFMLESPPMTSGR